MVDALIEKCRDSTLENLGSAMEGTGRSVVKISDKIVIKYGIGVTENEARSQATAWELFDPKIVRVPQVYGYFSRAGRGYLVMEYVEGRNLNPLEDRRYIRKVAQVLGYMWTFTRRAPGPLGYGAARGLLWPDDQEIYLKSMDEIERFFNSRLRKGSPNLALEQNHAVLCHLDIAPRNILWLEDGTLCLLDWECAGYYPRCFEICVQRIVSGKDGAFNEILLGDIPDLTQEEEAQVRLMMEAFSNSQKYHLWVPSSKCRRAS